MGGGISSHSDSTNVAEKHGSQHRFPEFGDIFGKLDSKLYTFNVDRSTQFWIQLCKLQITNSKPDSSVVKKIGSKKILNLHPGAVHGFETAVRFTDLDEDYGDLDESLGGMVQGAIFLQLQNLDNDESELDFFPSIERGIEVGRDVLGKALPQAIEPWHDLQSDDSMSKLAFYGLGQLYLTAVRSSLAAEAPGAMFEIDLSFMFQYETRKPFERYGCIAFFGADKNIIGIYWCLNAKMCVPVDPASADQEARAEWEHVKFVFKATLITAITLKDHLVHVHWTISNNLLFASRQSFSPNHPLRRLLKPHTYRAASINWASKTVLLPDDALAWRVFALSKKDWYRAINDCIHANKFQTFDTYAAEKGLPKEVEDTLPFLQDGKDLTAVIRKYVSDYLSVFYADDAAVLADPEIHTYWAHFGHLPLWPSYHLPPLSKSALIEQITHGIFGVTGMHEFVGSIVEYLSSPAGLGNKIVPGKAEADVQSFFQALSLIALTGIRQPALINDWKHILLHDDLVGDQRAAVGNIVDDFQSDLKALAKEIDARNADASVRKKRFMSMNPSVLECSVSV